MKQSEAKEKKMRKDRFNKIGKMSIKAEVE